MEFDEGWQTPLDDGLPKSSQTDLPRGVELLRPHLGSLQVRARTSGFVKVRATIEDGDTCRAEAT